MAKTEQEQNSQENMLYQHPYVYGLVDTVATTTWKTVIKKSVVICSPSYFTALEQLWMRNTVILLIARLTLTLLIMN